MSTEQVQTVAPTAAQSTGYFDAFVGLVGKYIDANGNESSREGYTYNGQPANTDAIYQPVTGTTAAGETITTGTADMFSPMKIAAYSAISLGAILTTVIVVKAMK